MQRPQIDRFVTPRTGLPDLSRRIRSRIPNKNADDIWYTKYLKEKKYADHIDSAFGLEPAKSETSSDPDNEKCLPLWPCTPRKKSYLSLADSILDLPSYSDAAFPDLLDWSNDNILVAALGRHYHKWSWRTQSQISQGRTDYDIQCCKFDPKGELLTLGTTEKTVEVHDTELSKRVEQNTCPCYNITAPYCSITALDWSPTGNSFITGCSRGMLASFTRDAKLIMGCNTNRSMILTVRVSPDARYVTAAVIDDDTLIFTWPMLDLIFAISKSSWTVTALTWHPWRSALLGIGAITPDLNGRVALWDVPTGKQREPTMARSRFSADSMLFSKRTGELVVNFTSTDRGFTHPYKYSQLVVMSDPDTVVDQWGEGRTELDCIRTMVFSPDGSQLATATADEDLIIWNFLPEDKRKKKKHCKKFCAMPVYLDKATSGVSFR